MKAFRSYIYHQEFIEQLLCGRHSTRLWVPLLGRHGSQLMTSGERDALG